MYLDAGTNNEQYLHDPLYLGLRQTRPSTEELYSFVDEFVEAVQEAFPKCCIHFEDWTGTPPESCSDVKRDRIQPPRRDRRACLRYYVGRIGRLTDCPVAIDGASDARQPVTGYVVVCTTTRASPM